MSFSQLGPLPSRSYSRARALGDGSYGAVCVAYEDDGGEEVAVKTFDPGEDGSLTTETLREISALRLLVNVPGIVPLLDVAWELSGVSVVSAVLPLYKWTVADAIKDTSSIFRGSVVLRTCVGLLRATSYIHNCTPPMVHRDIKPENVMLDDHMDPVLIDFSFCKFLESEHEAEPTKKRKKRKKQISATEEKSKNTGNLGTPTYVAPEVLEAKPYDARADVWSLGVLFLEALQKKRLETERDKAALRIIAEKRSQLSSKPIPAALHAMLNPDYTKRSTSSEALKMFLEATADANIIIPQLSYPEPIILSTTKSKPRNEVKKLCALLDFQSPQTAVAASHYLDLVGVVEASYPDVPLFATLVAAKLYERDSLDVFEAEDELNQSIDAEAFVMFEENLLRLSGCCLFTSKPG